MTKPRKVLFTLVMLAIPLGFLALLEVGARVLKPARPNREELVEGLRSSEKTEEKTIEEGHTLRGLIRPSDDPEIVYEIKPSHTWRFQGAQVRSNAAGFRGREFTQAKPAGTCRVVGIGDSVMFGWGVEEQDAYMSRLERSLGEGTEVLNFAVPGYNTVQEVALYRRRILAYAPDVLIVGYNLNDWVAPFYVRDPDRAGRLLPHSRLLELLKERATPDAGPREGLDQVEAALHSLGELTRQHGTRVVFFIYPMPMSMDDRRSFEKTARGKGFVSVDLHPLFESYLQAHNLHGIEDIGVSSTDPHPNPDGHRLVAEGILPAVREALAPCSASRPKGESPR